MHSKDFHLSLTGFNDLEQINPTSGYLEYWPLTTNTHSLLGKGPQKYASTVFCGLTGRSVILVGSGWWVSVATWQLKLVLMIFLMHLFMWGDQYIFLMSSVVFEMPKCSCLWVMVIILSHSDSGGMILFSLWRMPSDITFSAFLL